MTGRRAAGIAAGAAAVAGAFIVVRTVLAHDTPAAPAARADVATASVQRRDLVVRETLQGQLGFDDVRRLAATRAGTVTQLAREGSVVRRGGVLYAIDGRGTYLLYGTTPAWRELRRGMSGKDVRQLERNLVALGYDPGGDVAADGKFDSATEAAVKRWQKARGVRRDGVVELGEVAFLPGPRRIGQHLVSLGAVVQPGADLAETSSVRKVVTVRLDASRQDLVREGDTVDVALPNGRTVRARVVEVGRVAEHETSTSGEEGDPYVVVTIVVSTAQGFDKAPVDVHVASERKKGVLSVPVEALLALAGGGYAVEVVSEHGTRLVRAHLGTFADGYVQVSGTGIREGMRVAVPR